MWPHIYSVPAIPEYNERLGTYNTGKVEVKFK